MRCACYVLGAPAAGRAGGSVPPFSVAGKVGRLAGPAQSGSLCLGNLGALQESFYTLWLQGLSQKLPPAPCFAVHEPVCSWFAASCRGAHKRWPLRVRRFCRPKQQHGARFLPSLPTSQPPTIFHSLLQSLARYARKNICVLPSVRSMSTPAARSATQVRHSGLLRPTLRALRALLSACGS